MQLEVFNTNACGAGLAIIGTMVAMDMQLPDIDLTLISVGVGVPETPVNTGELWKGPLFRLFSKSDPNGLVTVIDPFVPQLGCTKVTVGAAGGTGTGFIVKGRTAETQPVIILRTRAV
jgi:hypothetical protein